jgi:hypothetical protein
MTQSESMMPEEMQPECAMVSHGKCMSFYKVARRKRGVIMAAGLVSLDRLIARVKAHPYPKTTAYAPSRLGNVIAAATAMQEPHQEQMAAQRGPWKESRAAPVLNHVQAQS